MKRTVLTTALLLASFGFTTAVPAASGNETKSWYIYCEGFGHGVNYAVFSQNIWPHPATEGYARRVGSAAEEFFESRNNVPLTGCSGVNFFDMASAEYSRSRTVKLHKKMGDTVYFFTLPNDLLSE